MAVKFSFRVEVNPCKDPHRVGEYLRSEFFLSDAYCDVKADVTNLGEEVIKEDEDYELTWKKFFKSVQGSDIMMRCSCDGDTFIEFHFSDGSALCNFDAKKDHWTYYQTDRYKNPWV